MSLAAWAAALGSLELTVCEAICWVGLIGLVRSLYGDVGFPLGTGGPLWGTGVCLGAGGKGPFVAMEELAISLNVRAFLGVDGGVGDLRLPSSTQQSLPVVPARRLT